jgi:hypothetical protein
VAIDTRDKRASVLGWGLTPRLVLPDPGTIDQPDRQHLACTYRGIAATAVVTNDGKIIFRNVLYV